MGPGAGELVGGSGPDGNGARSDVSGGDQLVGGPGTPLIAVSDRLSGDQRTKTLAHEAAHWLADHRGSVARSDAETVAESSAFVVLGRFGIDAGSYTFPYVAHWAQDTAVLRRNLTEVQGIAAGLIAGIEAATAIFRRPMCGQSTSDGGR